MAESAATERGFYGIGIVGSKTPINVGTLWRSAGILGASFIFTAGRRYPQQASDTIKAWRHTPFFENAHRAEFVRRAHRHSQREQEILRAREEAETNG